MDEREKEFFQFYDDLNNAWREFIDALVEMFENIGKRFHEALAEVFKLNQKHKRHKHSKIVKCLGCRPKTKIFKRFKDHRNCKKYRR